jgi:alkylated DNA repair protein (DNA oxidative demethylase)
MAVSAGAGHRAPGLSLVMDGPPPPGFRLEPDVVSEHEEATLLAQLREIEFSAVEMRGQVARRRTAHFGWIYGYESWRISPGPPIPVFLASLRLSAAALAGVAPETLAEVLVTDYPPAAGIGWHRDAPQFGVVVGVSLLGACRMRFQHGTGAARRTAAIVLAPRSAYVIDGEARWQWQHSIPPMAAQRYSVTFRTLRTSPDTVTPDP